jgi:hypothetical protein
MPLKQYQNGYTLIIESEYPLLNKAAISKQDSRPIERGSKAGPLAITSLPIIKGHRPASGPEVNLPAALLPDYELDSKSGNNNLLFLRFTNTVKIF